jgi:hypothetical protein
MTEKIANKHNTNEDDTPTEAELVTPGAVVGPLNILQELELGLHNVELEYPS